MSILCLFVRQLKFFSQHLKQARRLMCICLFFHLDTFPNTGQKEKHIGIFSNAFFSESSLLCSSLLVHDNPLKIWRPSMNPGPVPRPTGLNENQFILVHTENMLIIMTCIKTRVDETCEKD